MGDQTIEISMAVLTQTVASLQTSVAEKFNGFTNAISKVEGKVDTGNSANIEIMKTLAVMDSKQGELSKRQDDYQNLCGEERKVIFNEVDRLDKRITEVREEAKNERQGIKDDMLKGKSYAVAISLFISCLFALGTLAAEVWAH